MRVDLAKLKSDASSIDDAERSFYQRLALSHIAARPVILDPAWELNRIVFLRGCQAAHYNPRDGNLYVGTRSTPRDGLYAIEANGQATRIADGDRVTAVAVHPEAGHVFATEVVSGKIFRTAFGTTGDETWVSDFKPADSDPVGMAFATQDYPGKLLSPGEGLVVDEGWLGLNQIYRFSSSTPEGEVLLYSDPKDEGPFVAPTDVTIGTTGIFVVDRKSEHPSRIFRLADDASLTPLHTSDPLTQPAGIATDPLTGDLLVADGGAAQLIRVNPETGEVHPIVDGVFIGQTPYAGVDVTPDGRQVFITDRASQAILTFNVRSAADFVRAIEENPDDPYRRLARARYHAHHGNLENARADFDKAVELAPSDSECWTRRACFHAEQNRIEQALEDATATIGLAPENWTTWCVRARIYAQSEHWDKAVADYCQAIDLAPHES
jgi:hypothetical protein